MLKTFTILTFLLLTLSIDINAQSPRMARVISERANLRDIPSANGNIEQEVAEGTIVRVLDKQVSWYVVRVGERVGWMHGNTLQFLKPEKSSLNSPPRPTPVIGDIATPRSNSSGSGNRGIRTSSVDRGYIRGPRGGCYYISGSGRKVYVERSLCD